MNEAWSGEVERPRKASEPLVGSLYWVNTLGVGRLYLRRGGRLVEVTVDRETYERLKVLGFEEKT